MARETRQKLIETAIDLIWQFSYGSVSVDDICKTAGVKKGSFYHFFPSKANLAVAAMEEYFLQKRAELDSVFSPAVPPLERFGNMVDMIIDHQQQALEKYGHVCGCPFASLGSEMAGKEEIIRAKMDEIFDYHRRYCVSALRDAVAQGDISDDIDIELLAGDLCTYVMGHMMMARIQNSLCFLQQDLKEGLFRIIGAKALEKL